MRVGGAASRSGGWVRRLPVLAGIALCLAGAACGADRGRGEPAADQLRLPVADVHVAYAFNPSDKRQLARFADNVFLGRVERRLGTTGARTSDPETTLPQTQVRVAVVENVKGRLHGTVTVSQYGGPVEVKRGRVDAHRPRTVMEIWEGDPLLRPGEVAMLATRHNRARGWHTIVAQPFGDRRVRSGTEGRELVREFQRVEKAPRRR